MSGWTNGKERRNFNWFQDHENQTIQDRETKKVRASSRTVKFKPKY
jgi:hypothetical protein